MLDLAFAMAPPTDGADPGGGSLLALLPPMIMMFMIFYFVLIRPQQKKQKEARQMVEDLKEGDTVVTLSGIHGTIKKLKKIRSCCKLLTMSASKSTVLPSAGRKIKLIFRGLK